MIYIVLIAVTAIVLIQSSGAIPQSSVGGPITIALVVFAATLAVGIHEAWTNGRGVLGWIVSIVVALVGAFAAAPLAGMVMVLIVALLNPGGGRLARGHGRPPVRSRPRRTYGPHALGSVGRAAGREPVAMSSLRMITAGAAPRRPAGRAAR